MKKLIIFILFSIFILSAHVGAYGVIGKIGTTDIRYRTTEVYVDVPDLNGKIHVLSYNKNQVYEFVKQEGSYVFGDIKLDHDTVKRDLVNVSKMSVAEADAVIANIFYNLDNKVYTRAHFEIFRLSTGEVLDEFDQESDIDVKCGDNGIDFGAEHRSHMRTWFQYINLKYKRPPDPLDPNIKVKSLMVKNMQGTYDDRAAFLMDNTTTIDLRAEIEYGGLDVTSQPVYCFFGPENLSQKGGRWLPSDKALILLDIKAGTGTYDFKIPAPKEIDTFPLYLYANCNGEDYIRVPEIEKAPDGNPYKDNKSNPVYISMIDQAIDLVAQKANGGNFLDTDAEIPVSMQVLSTGIKDASVNFDISLNGTHYTRTAIVRPGSYTYPFIIDSPGRAGTFPLTIKVNSDEAIVEINYTNNTASSTVTIDHVPPPPPPGAERTTVKLMFKEMQNYNVDSDWNNGPTTFSLKSGYGMPVVAELTEFSSQQPHSDYPKPSPSICGGLDVNSVAYQYSYGFTIKDINAQLYTNISNPSLAFNSAPNSTGRYSMSFAQEFVNNAKEKARFYLEPSSYPRGYRKIYTMPNQKDGSYNIVANVNVTADWTDYWTYKSVKHYCCCGRINDSETYYCDYHQRDHTYRFHNCGKCGCAGCRGTMVHSGVEYVPRSNRPINNQQALGTVNVNGSMFEDDSLIITR